MPAKKKRLTPCVPTLDRSAPFWTGDTAEKVIAARKQRYADEAAAKAAAKAVKAADRSSKTRLPVDLSTPAGIQRRLKRLQRALARRKTLDARQRIQREIRDLMKKVKA